MAAGDNISGKEGTISIDGTSYDVTSFDVSVTGSTIDVTDSADSNSGWRRKIVGKFKEWSGTAEMFLKLGEAAPGANVEGEFVGTAQATSGTVTYTGQINVVDIGDSIPVEAEEAVKVTMSFDGLGALTKINSAT